MKLIGIIILVFLVSCTDSKKSEKAPEVSKKTETKASILNIGFESKNGSQVSGEIKIEESEVGLTFTGSINGLTPGAEHGFHVHESGDCTADDGSSAGGHFSGEGQSHGGPDTEKSHFGDLGNIKADEEGKSKISIVRKNLTLKEGEKNSIHSRSMIIHAKADDLKSQPSGAAGKRIACAVIM